MWLLTVCKKLSENKVKFALVGGYAVALHGVVRGTVDIDLVVAVDAKNLLNLESSLKSLGLVSRIPVTSHEVAKFHKEFIEKRNLIAWSFVDFKNPARVVDAIIAHPFKEKDVVQMSVEGQKIPVLNIKALINMKKKSGRPQDLEDARALQERYEES